MKVNARTEEFEQLELFDKPALFTNGRIDRSTVPEGWYAYDFRGSDDDPGELYVIEEKPVVVNHSGTALMPEKLEYKVPLAMGFEILAYNLENGVLTLDVDAAYRELSFTTEVLVRAALVYSLEQLEDVNYVSITIEGNPLRDKAGSLVGIMNSSMFLNNMGSEISSYDTANLVLYFSNEAGDQLIAVNRQKAYNTNISLERLVVEELIAGPSATVEGLCATIDPGTKVISVMTKDGVCYVNVDEAFLSAVSNVTADVTIYSIVNSLVELNHINKVQISVNGDTSGMFREKYSLGTVFERNLDLVTTLSK